MCKNWREKGSCKYNDKCLFAHGQSELTKRSSLNGPEPKKLVPAKPAAIETKEAAVVPEKAAEEPTEKHLSEAKPEVKTESLKIGGPIFETPFKTDSPTELLTPAFSSS